ncbi:MAG: RpiB/LacA/LacB family sugar-phosphate isomerase [Pyrinomonadaceae bacterium]
MSEPTDNTRDRVRALVKEVLSSVPDAAPVEPRATPEHVVVNSLKDKLGREFDRDESAKSLITEDDLRGLDRGARVRIAESARLTPLAQDLVRDFEIELIRKTGRQNLIKLRTVSVGADHGGFAVKEQIRIWLERAGLQVIDRGTDSTDAVDYPDHAHAVARDVAERRADVGIVVDGAGIGSAITANKVPGVRAAACYSPALAVNSREHNGANVLTLGSGQNSIEEIKEIVQAFLASELTEERHKRRVGKIDQIDGSYRGRI